MQHSLSVGDGNGHRIFDHHGFKHLCPDTPLLKFHYPRIRLYVAMSCTAALCWWNLLGTRVLLTIAIHPRSLSNFWITHKQQRCGQVENTANCAANMSHILHKKELDEECCPDKRRRHRCCCRMPTGLSAYARNTKHGTAVVHGNCVEKQFGLISKA